MKSELESIDNFLSYTDYYQIIWSQYRYIWICSNCNNLIEQSACVCANCGEDDKYVMHNAKKVELKQNKKTTWREFWRYFPSGIDYNLIRLYVLKDRKIIHKSEQFISY